MDGLNTPEGADALAVLQAKCAEHERVLRLQYPGRKLPSDLERELAAAPADTVLSAVDRLVALKLAYGHVAAPKAERGRDGDGGGDAAAAQLAALQLLAREPVPVRLTSGRVVHVTGRSVAAMVELAAHEAHLAMLQAELSEQRDLLVRTLARRKRMVGGLRRRWRFRRFHRRQVERYEALYTEVLRHRERLVAHLATPDGSRASLETPAPDWWQEVTPEDEARLFLAAFEAGPGRAARIPIEEREPSGPGKSPPADGLLYPRLLTGWGIRMGVRAAELHNRDFGPTWLELQTAPSYATEDEEEGG